MKKIVVLTGAGISAESGIKTFRDAGGLWEGHDIYEVASPEGFLKNPALVLDFYNKRRAQLQTVDPNEAHRAITKLERKYDLVVITQNVDDLHERAGTKRIIHLHGELLKVRPINNENEVLNWPGDLNLGDLSEKGIQLRPHIVWFGEMVPKLEEAIKEISNADIVLIVGTSMQVYPAASLTAYSPQNSKIYYVDPKPKINYELAKSKNLKVIEENASTAVPELAAKLLSME